MKSDLDLKKLKSKLEDTLICSLVRIYDSDIYIADEWIEFRYTLCGSKPDVSEKIECKHQEQV